MQVSIVYVPNQAAWRFTVFNMASDVDVDVLIAKHHDLQERNQKKSNKNCKFGC